MNITVNAAGLEPLHFVVISRRNPLWAIAAGTCVYVAALRLGLLYSL
jgi:hypothetical protein